MNKLVIALAAILLGAGIIALSQTRTGQAQLARTAWRLSLPVQFPDTAKELDLSGQQTEELFDLLASQQEKLGDYSQGLLTEAARDTAARESMQRKLVDQQRANQAELTALLGPKYQRWLAYQSNLAVHQQVEELQSRLSTGSNALSAALAQSLIAALAPEALRLDQELRAWDESEDAVASPHLLDQHIRRTLANQRQLLKVASPYLNEAQRDEYWRVLDQILMREVALTRDVGKFGTAPVKTNTSLLPPGAH